MACHSLVAFAVPSHGLGNNVQTCRIKSNRTWWEERLEVCFSTNEIIPQKISHGCPPYPPLFTLSEQSVSRQKQRLNHAEEERKTNTCQPRKPMLPSSLSRYFKRGCGSPEVETQASWEARRALKNWKWTSGTKMNVSRVRFTQSSLPFLALPKSHLFFVTFFPRQHHPPPPPPPTPTPPPPHTQSLCSLLHPRRSALVQTASLRA